MVTSTLVQSTVTKVPISSVSTVNSERMLLIKHFLITYNRFRLWGAEIGGKPPEISYEEVIGSDKGVAKWTSKIVS